MIRWRIVICLCLLSLSLAQELQVKAKFIHIPDIDESYNIVNTLIYPTADSRFKGTLSGDYFVKKIKQIQEAQAKSGKVLGKPAEKQKKADMLKKGDFSNKQLNVKDPYTPQPVQPAIPANPNLLKKKDPVSLPSVKKKNEIQMSKINNDGKRIIWRAFDILPISSTVMDDGVEFTLQKTGSADSIKVQHKEAKDIEIKKKEINVPVQITPEKPKLTPKIQKQSKLEEKKQIPNIPIIQKIEKPLDKPEFHPNLQFTSQPHKQNHITQRKDLLIIIIIIVIAFLIFLVVQYRRTKKENIWSNISNQLESYHSSSIKQDDEQEIQNLESQKESKQMEETQDESAY